MGGNILFGGLEGRNTCSIYKTHVECWLFTTRVIVRSLRLQVHISLICHCCSVGGRNLFGGVGNVCWFFSLKILLGRHPRRHDDNIVAKKIKSGKKENKLQE